jgi:hypothetical protein
MPRVSVFIFEIAKKRMKNTILLYALYYDLATYSREVNYPTEST